jgi:hypothetical protein
MSNFLLICLLLLQLPAPQDAKWQTVETTTFRWRKGGSPYTLIVESPGRDAENGRLRIKVPGRRDFMLPVSDGVATISDGLLDKKGAADNLLNSDYLYLTPKLKSSEGTPMLVMFGGGGGSSPGSLHVLSLDKTGYPIEMFSSGNFELAALTDLDGDGASEIVGKRCLSQMIGTDLSTYDPYSVYRLPRARAGMASYSLALSKRYNLKHYYGWAGRDCREDVLVALHASKGKPRIVSAKEVERLSRN